MKRLISLLSALTLICTMTACSSGSDSESSQAEVETMTVSQTMYKETYAEFPEDMATTEAFGYVNGKGIRLVYRTDSAFRFADYNDDLTDYTAHDLCPNDNVYSEFFDMHADGSITALIQYVESDFEIGTDEYYSNAVVTYKLLRFSPDGELLSDDDFDLSHFITFRDDFIMSFYELGDKYIIQMNKGTYLLNSDGDIEDSTDKSDNIRYGYDCDGRLIAAAFKGYTYLDEPSIRLPEELTEYGKYVNMQQGIAAGQDGFKAYFMLGDGIFGLAENGDVVKVLDYQSSMMTCSDYYHLAYAGEGRFAAVGHDDADRFLSVLNIRPEGYVMNRQDVSLGVVGECMQDIGSICSKYNKKSDNYMVKSKTYKTFDDLKDAVLSGDSPDVAFYRDPEDMYKLTNLGAAADMYELSEQYGGFTKDDVLDNIIEAYEYKGGLHMMSMDFALYTPIANRRMFDKTYMSVPEFLEVVDSMPEDMYFGDAFGNNYPHDVFQWACLDNIKGWVDFENAECHFDSPDFIDLLNMTVNIPLLPEPDYDELEKIPVEEYVIFEEAEWDRLKNGTSLIAKDYWMHRVSDLYDNLIHYNNIPREDVIVVYPPSDNPAGMIYANSAYFSVMNGAKCTEGGWDFVNYILSDQFLTTYLQTSGMFVSMKSANEKIMKAEMDRVNYYADLENGGYVNYNGKMIKRYRITEEDIEECRELFKGSTVVWGAYSDLTAIITDEYSQFEAGEITAETCAERIQNRVSIYLSEQS